MSATTGSAVLWTIRTALEWTQGYLTEKGEDNPRLAAQWLLCAATNLERIELFTHYDQPLSETERASLREGIQRRLTGEPLQYILGRAPFRHLELKVAPGVLIPRPETEVLVGLVLEALAVRGEDVEREGAELAPPAEQPFTERPKGAPRIIDIGTGTGAIALSLLSELPGCSVLATDSNPAAVALAQENALALGLTAGLLAREDDLATSLLSDAEFRGRCDVVVSNPPYIPTALLSELPPEVVQFEPRMALDGGEDGLAVYRRILEQARVLLAPGGLLACELYEDCLVAAAALAEEAGFVAVCVHPDLTGRDRVLTAQQATVW